MINTTLQKYQNMWKNLTIPRIDEIGELMVELYSNLEERPIITSNSDREEKRQDALDRFADLGIFMEDSGAIEIIRQQNEEFYKFMEQQFYTHPFLLKPEEYAKLYCIDSTKSFIEAKAELIDAENKVAKMCAAQMANIVTSNIPETYKGEERLDLIESRYAFYTSIYDALRKSNLKKEMQVEPNAEKWFSGFYNEDGSFDMENFLEVVKDIHTPKGQEEFLLIYGHLLVHIANTNPKFKRHIDKYEILAKDEAKKAPPSLIDVGRFAIARELSRKLYSNKIADLKDLIQEYDLITGTPEKEKILITSCDSDDKNIAISNVGVEIYIQGYTQPFKIHLPDAVYKKIEKQYGTIPKTPSELTAPKIIQVKEPRKNEFGVEVLISTNYRSILTRKFKPDELRAIESMKTENTYGIVRHYLEYIKNVQYMAQHRKKMESQQERKKKDVTMQILQIQREIRITKQEKKQKAIESIREGIKRISVAEKKLASLNAKLAKLLKLRQDYERELI